MLKNSVDQQGKQRFFWLQILKLGREDNENFDKDGEE